MPSFGDSRAFDRDRRSHAGSSRDTGTGSRNRLGRPGHVENPSNPIDRIFKGVYLSRMHVFGDEYLKDHPDFFDEIAPTAVLSLNGPLQGEYLRNVLAAGIDEEKLKAFRLEDGPGNDFRVMQMAVKTLTRLIKAGETVIVHCHAGRSRSPAVVIGFLMLSRGLEYDRAERIVARKRNIVVDPNVKLLTERFELFIDGVESQPSNGQVEATEDDEDDGYDTGSAEDPPYGDVDEDDLYI